MARRQLERELPLYINAGGTRYHIWWLHWSGLYCAWAVRLPGTQTLLTILAVYTGIMPAWITRILVQPRYQGTRYHQPAICTHSHPNPQPEDVEIILVACAYVETTNVARGWSRVSSSLFWKCLGLPLFLIKEPVHEQMV